MPSSIQNPEGLTLRKLISNTFHHMRNRVDYMNRDVLRSVKIKKVSVYDGKNPGKARTKFIIESRSYPQYYPYYTRRDSRGRPRSRQRSYRHEYDITIQLDSLSLDSDRIKLRTGADAKWDFGEAGKTKKDSRGRIIEGTNVKRGVNGDFFFRLSYIRKQSGILFGRNFANGPPIHTNPNQIQFLTKHELQVIQYLVDTGILQ